MSPCFIIVEDQKGPLVKAQAGMEYESFFFPIKERRFSCKENAMRLGRFPKPLNHRTQNHCKNLKIIPLVVPVNVSHVSETSEQEGRERKALVD